jgi:hypothetical protein
MRVIAIDPFDRWLRPCDLPLEGVELCTDWLMVLVFWLTASDALYAVETEPIVQHYFFIRGEAVYGPGLIVGHDNHGGVLPAPTMSEGEVAKAVSFGSAPVPFVKKHRYFPGIE